MQVEVTAQAPLDADAELTVVGLTEGDSLPADLAQATGAGDAKGTFKRLTVVYPEGRRVLVAGLGAREELDPERLRVVAAAAAKHATSTEASSLAWALPDGLEPADAAGAIAEGTILATYRFDRRSRETDEDGPTPALQRLVLVGDDGPDTVAAGERARVAAEAANRARTLQNLPANELNPEALAARAVELADTHEAITVEVLDREAIRAAGMGGLVAVSQGSAAEPRLIALRYAGGGDGPRVGLVGKAVTFDSGGISIKPSAGMHEMKFDMSGGAAVIEGLGAIAELGLPVDLVAVVPATENMPSGTAMRPGDIIAQLNGKTVEINNTDAEGRLILADALTYCVRELEAERVVDFATLTGAVLIALGSTYAALISNDNDWAAAITEAADASGELVWRLPLHPEYKQLTKGTVADLTNAAAKRKAGTIYAGSFLEEFVDDVPWAHVDIAGTAWDTGREYVGKGATGFGVRLVVRLALALAGADSRSQG